MPLGISVEKYAMTSLLKLRIRSNNILRGNIHYCAVFFTIDYGFIFTGFFLKHILFSFCQTFIKNLEI